MKRTEGTRALRAVILAAAVVLAAPVASSQRIGFGAYTTDAGITLTKGSISSLDFNAVQPVIMAGSNATVEIVLTNGAVLAINGDATRDVTVDITADDSLVSSGAHRLKLACKMAYSNLGDASETAAKTRAVPVPAGFRGVTFPLLRRSSGAPAPPPTPAHGGYAAPKATAYLILYGTLGPVQNVDIGTYTGTINVTVEYAK